MNGGNYGYLGGNKIFGNAWMKSDYHQLQVFEEHTCRKAFIVCSLRFWEFDKPSFGLTIVPAICQRLMLISVEAILTWKFFIIIRFSITLDEHFQGSVQIHERLMECYLKLNPKECKYVQTKERYVGHIVLKNDVVADPQNIEKGLNLTICNTN